MRIRLLRWLPTAVCCWGSCLAGYCVLATGPTVLGQHVEAAAGEEPPAGKEDSNAKNESTEKPQEPAGADPQAAAPLEETATKHATQPPPQPEPASLDGVRVGATTREQLHKLWGKPRQTERVAGGARETYHLDKLGTVRATIAEDIVAALSVHIEHPLALAVAIGRLAIDDVEPVDVLDEHGEVLGAAYPPRGVL